MNELEQDYTFEALEKAADEAQLRRKLRAVTAGMIVEFEPHEMEAAGIHGEPFYGDESEMWEESRFDECEYDLENYPLDEE